MRRTFVSASIHPGKFDNKNHYHWPTSEGWSAQVEVSNEDEKADGSKLFVNETLTFHHYDFTKVWEFVAQVYLDCVENVRNIGGIK